MKTVTPITRYIDTDEPVYAMAELYLTPHRLTRGGSKYVPDTWSGRQRWRITWVNRGDALAEYHELSPHIGASQEIRVPSLWCHSYAECAAMIDDYVVGPKGAQRDQEYVAELQAESTLIADFMQDIENRALMARNTSSFGALVKVQRNGFPNVLRKDD